MDQYIGRLLDNRYEILEIIGTGGMAVVYKARCHRLNRLVAIKILKSEFSSDEEFVRRFNAEGEAVAMLSHPNIVQVYDVSSTGGANYIVMELVDGISLKQYMGKKGILNWKETLHFAMQIAKGLEHAHSRGIVHRDIKPHNVMVLKNGSVKVMDFGIARVMSRTNTLTKEALGSVHYISPEQAKGGWVDNRSDIYSLSVVMYEMMAGRPPYDGETPVSVAIQHINGGAMMPSTLNPNIPGGLEQIIMKGMSLDANDRYTSATEMLRDMDEFRKDPTILFYYGSPTSVGIDATQPINLGSVSSRVTTADRVVRRTEGGQNRMGDTSRVRTGTAPSQRNRPNPQSRSNTGNIPQRRPQPQKRRKNRVTTLAVFACSAVAVLAIAIWLIALTSGALFNQNKELVKVPDIVGESYAPIMEGFTVEYSKGVHHDAIPKNQILHQEPVAGEKVRKGTIITVTVSLGPAAEVKVMANLEGQTLENAMSFLRTQGMNPLAKEEYSDIIKEGKVIRTDPEVDSVLTDNQTVYVYYSIGPAPEGEIPTEAKTMINLAGQTLEDAMSFLRTQGMNPLTKEEYSDSVEEGKVIRTYPEVNTEIAEGQTVYVYYSVGPLIKTAEIPNLVGHDYATAYRLLTQLGFSNISAESVESNEPKDEVVFQPYERGTKVDITEHIVLKISKGPKTTEKMPNVVGKSYAQAEKELKALGFTNVTFAIVDHEKPINTVVDQPFRVNAEVNKAEKIILTISSGSKPTEATTAPTETEPQPKTVTVTFSLPKERTEAYELVIKQNDKIVVETQVIEPGTESFTVKLTGTGKETYDLYINNEFYNSQEVNFGG